MLRWVMENFPVPLSYIVNSYVLVFIDIGIFLWWRQVGQYCMMKDPTYVIS